jgi:hypothetical protein
MMVHFDYTIANHSPGKHCEMGIAARVRLCQKKRQNAERNVRGKVD